MDNTIIISTGESRKATTWTPEKVTWPDLCARLRDPVRTAETEAEYQAMPRADKAAAKDVGGFVGGLLEGGRRKRDNLRMRQLLALDADFVRDDLWEAWELFAGYAACLYSTHSSTKDEPRYRLLVPLSRAVEPDEYEAIGRRVAAWLDIEAFDDTTYEPSRLMYWPSCPADSEYTFREMDGKWLDPDEVLSSYADWRDTSCWPRSSRQTEIVTRHADKAGDPLAKPGLIGAFNRTYTVPEAIDRYLADTYVPAGDGRYTYTGGTTAGGAVLYDDERFLYSHHDTDPISGRLCNAFDLVRLHLYGALDAEAEPGTPLTDLPSHFAMNRLISDDEEVMAEYQRSVLDSARLDFDAAGDEQLDGPPVPGGFDLFSDLTDEGRARMFAKHNTANTRYSPALGWCVWEGQSWVTNDEPGAINHVMAWNDVVLQSARIMLDTAADTAAEKHAKECLSWASKGRSAGNIFAVARLSRKHLLTDIARFDADPWVLNTPAGLVDLRTGETRQHDAAALCTKITAADPRAKSESTRWTDFLTHLTGGDKDFEIYLQTLAGMSAVGAVYEEGMVISHGPGGNGKSTFFGALRRVLGQYATALNADVLVSRDGRTDQSYVAALRGVRLAIMGETDEGARFGVAAMKRITSRDSISARALYHDPIEFTPTHTTIMHTNHLPRLDSLDVGTKRRIAVAPFPATLPPDKVITNFEEMLVAECGGEILRWIIEGAVRFHAAGCKLIKPACVIRATQEYLGEQNWLERFLAARCEVGNKTYTAPGGELYQVYRAWAESEGERSKRGSDFAAALQAAGYERRKTKAGATWYGLRIDYERED